MDKQSKITEKIRDYEFWKKIAEAIKLLMECFVNKTPKNYDLAIEHLLAFLNDIGLIRKTSWA